MLLALVLATVPPVNGNAMFQLTSEIDIGEFEYSGVVELEVQSSWDNLTDKASLTFPRKVSWKGKDIATGASPLIKNLDPVSIQVGYDGNNKEVFQGYVHRVHADIPVTVTCEDAMYLLKNNTITKSYQEVDLKILLQDILPTQVPFQAPAVRLGQFRISNATPAQVLEELKRTYFLKSWFREGTLYVGLAYRPELQSEHQIRFDRNVVEHSLEFVNEDDVRIKLKVISISPDNAKTEFEFGDPQGEQRTVYVYDKNPDDIKFFADQEISRLKYSGYRGELTTFLQPTINHGDVVHLNDPFYPERSGSYLVKSVTTRFGQEGGRQVLQLDSKV